MTRHVRTYRSRCLAVLVLLALALLPAPLFPLPVQLTPGEASALHLRVAVRTVTDLPLAAYDVQAYVGQASVAGAWLGLFFGVILTTLVFAGFIWRITRDRVFLDFGIAILLAAGYFAGFDGLLAAAWPALAPAQQTVMFFCACLSVTFTLRFAVGFLASGSRSPRLARAMRVLATIALLVSFLMAVLPLLWSMAIAMLFSVAMAVLILAAGIVALRSGFAPARLFVLAISVHLASIVLLSVAALVDIPGLFASANQVHRIGFVFNLVCFTFALGQRLRLRLLDEERRRVGEHMRQVSAEQCARNEFQARMSHELRTPMTGVLGMAELLDHTELDTRQRRYLATLRYSGEILLNLINDMLDHARIESGRLQIHRAAFDLFRLVDDCRQLFEQQPRDNGVSLRIEIDPGVSRVVVGDAVRLRQILVNVLLQAFRGTGRGHVDLRIRLAEPDGWLHFDVLHPAAPAKATGPEAALTTSVRLVELMGGHLTMQPAPGVGMRCRIEVPLFAAA